MVVQKGVLESPLLLCLLKVFRTFQVFEKQTLSGQRRNGLSKTAFWTTVAPYDAFATPLARSELHYSYITVIRWNQLELRNP